jgi:hypothetical protein
MYTYIYTEKPMNFYREGTVISLTALQEVVLSGATLKHKAVFFPNTSASVNQVKLTFWGADATGVTLTVPAVGTGVQTPCIYPGVVRSVMANGSGQSIVLLN